MVLIKRLNKKAISAIVATILIILIVIVGVGIIWGVVLPLFSEIGYLSYSDIKLDIVMEGYTVYDPEMHFAFVQVARGNDNQDLTGLEFIFNINGSSVPYRNYEVPAKNERKTYKFDFDDDGIVGTPSSVGIAPVFNFNGQERVGEVMSTQEIPSQRIDLNDPEWQNARQEAITSVVREDYLDKNGVLVDYYYDGDGDQYGPGQSGKYKRGENPVGYFLEGQLAAISGDCDDTNPDINPGEEEISGNEIDENCDGTSLVVFFFDNDQDGYSNGSISFEFDENPNWDNLTLNLGDCNDFDEGTSPIAVEVMNDNSDENCDGYFQIDRCMGLTNDNARYALANDLFLEEGTDWLPYVYSEMYYYSPCFDIQGRGITFDLRGYKIDGTYGGYYDDELGDWVENTVAFLVREDSSNITGGEIYDLNFGVVVYSDYNSFSNLRLENNSIGAKVENGDYNDFGDIEVIENYYKGFYIYKSHHNVLHDIVSFNHTGNNNHMALDLLFSDYNEVYNVNSDRDEEGIWVSWGSKYNKLHDIVLNGSFYGMRIGSSTLNNYSNIIVKNGAISGTAIRLENASNNYLENITLEKNTMGLIFAPIWDGSGSSSNNVVKNLNSTGNSYGLYVQYSLVKSRDNSIIDSVLCGNTKDCSSNGLNIGSGNKIGIFDSSGRCNDIGLPNTC